MTNTLKVRQRKKELLRKIPGKNKIPFFGDVFSFMKDPFALFKSKQAAFGNIYKGVYLGKAGITILDKEANKYLLVEQGKYLSSEKAWETSLKDLFPNGLMLMDGERHKKHRGILRKAFEKDPMQGYLELMKPIISNYLDNWKSRDSVQFFFEIKELTLQIAGKVFFGLEFDEKLSQINDSIIKVVKASTALPIPFPPFKYWKGLKGRKHLETYFLELIKEKRSNPGRDLFSQLCLVKDEERNQLTDKEIVDHVIFILMAAHDTTASTISSMMYLLLKNPDWMQELRTELSLHDFEQIGNISGLRKLGQMGLVIKETLRMYPPLIVIPRHTLKEIEFGGYTFPADTPLLIVLNHNHYTDQIWENPQQFEPERFLSERKEHQKCPHAYAPFGAGVHYCLGFAFAEMQIKMIMANILQKYNPEIDEDYLCEYSPIPIQEPKDGLPISISNRVFQKA